MLMTPKSLNCPNCGGAVMSDKTQCEYCRSRLKTVGCPSCLGVMFLGSKFCSNCGEKAGDVHVLEDDKARNCPRCKISLELLDIGGISIRECTKCGGFWSSNEVFERLCSDRESQSAVLGFIISDAHPDFSPSKISYVPCPECAQLMNRNNFAKTSGIIIDRCRNHGIWFDADELPKIVSFINDGGLDHAREKEKASLEDLKRQIYDKQRQQQLYDRRFANNIGGDKRSVQTKFESFLERFFDL